MNILHSVSKERGSANKVFAGILSVLLLMAVVAYCTAREVRSDQVFAENMAAAQAEVSRAQAEAIEAQAEAIAIQAQINEEVVRANLERAKTDTLLVKVGIVALTLGTLVLLALAGLVALDVVRRRKAAAPGKAANDGE